MKLKMLILSVSLFSAVAIAKADAGGNFTVEGKTFNLLGAYAYTCPNPYDQTKPATVITFSIRKLDAKAIESADDPAAALSAAVNAYLPAQEARPAHVKVIFARLDPESPITDISFSIPELSSQASSNIASYVLDLKRNDDKRIEGTLVSKNESAKTQKYGGGYFDLKFALDVNPECL